MRWQNPVYLRNIGELTLRSSRRTDTKSPISKHGPNCMNLSCLPKYTFFKQFGAVQQLNSIRLDSNLCFSKVFTVRATHAQHKIESQIRFYAWNTTALLVHLHPQHMNSHNSSRRCEFFMDKHEIYQKIGRKLMYTCLTFRSSNVRSASLGYYRVDLFILREDAEASYSKYLSNSRNAIPFSFFHGANTIKLEFSIWHIIVSCEG